MTLATYYAKGVDISEALTALEPLGPDEYFVAFGTGGRQFCGTPNGYSAVHLPAKIVRDLASGRAKAKQIVWASFGAHSDSWFFRYKTHDGRSLSLYGNAAPAALRQFIEESYASTSPHLFASMRVQLGSDDSFLAWTKCLWICHKVPTALIKILIEESGQHSQNHEGLAKGLFKYKAPIHVSWHEYGSYYYQTNNSHLWNFQSSITQNGWNEIWHGHEGDDFTTSELSDLAFAGIDPHSADGDNFVFIKKRKLGNEVDFALRFSPEDIISRVASRDIVKQAPKVRLEQVPVFKAVSQQDERLQRIPQLHKEPETFRWARSKNTGRPHPKDNWELAMKKGEMVKVTREHGRDWYVVRNARGMQGFAHKTWLDFKMKMHIDPREAYARFSDEMDLLLKPGTLHLFPDLSKYMDVCEEAGCKVLKEDSAGIAICAHDLERLLRGSGAYTVDLLKSERNTWHPDKFSRYCHADSRDDLKAKAGSLFVLFGVLIDLLQKPPGNP